MNQASVVVWRHVAGVALVSLVALSGTACGGGSGQGEAGPQPASSTSFSAAPVQQTQSPPTQTSTPAAPDASFANVGSFLYSAQGETLQTSVSVGQPLSSGQSPPQDVLAACGWDDPVVKDGSAWIPVRIELDYRGSQTVQVGFNSGGSNDVVDVGETQQFGVGGVPVAISDADGSSWSECPNSQPWGTEMAPGQVLQLNAWILLPVITNAHPALQASDLHNLVWTTAAVDFDGPMQATVTANGSNAVACTVSGGTVPFESALALYTRPPFDVAGENVNGDSVAGHCSAPDS